MLKQYRAKPWFRATLLFLALIIMIFLSSNNVVKVTPDYRPKLSENKQAQINDQVKELMKREHEKALDEIKTSLEQMDTWYHYKFIFIGGVIAVFLGNVGIFGKRSSDSHIESEISLESALMSNRTAAMLTLICIIAFVVDMHIRSNVNGIQQLGLWISSYVEPSVLKSAGITADITTQQYVKDALAETGFLPWEIFTRIPRTSGGTLYAIAYSIQLHFTTILSYLFYIMVFQNISLISKKGERQQIAVIGFISVHISLLAFILAAHTVRNIFYVACLPMVSLDVCSVSGSYGSICYFIAWLFLVGINLPYLLRSKSETVVPDTAQAATD